MRAEYSAACFTARQDDSSPIVTEKRAERNDPAAMLASGSAHTPMTSDEALRLAIKVAVDAGDYDRATMLIDVAKRTPALATVVPLDGARRERGGTR
jgi:hypothetical protein